MTLNETTLLEGLLYSELKTMTKIHYIPVVPDILFKAKFSP